MDAITQEDLMIIKNAILNILEGVEAIYLFGSVARGTHNAGSDYDIVAFVKKAPKNKVKIVINIKHDVSDRIKRPIDLFILGLDDLQFASPFLYEVFHNNHLLYGNNVISSCEDTIKDISPLIIDGEKIGYKVKAGNAFAINHLIEAIDHKKVLELMIGKSDHGHPLQYMEQLCEISTKACLCAFSIVITKEHIFSSVIEKLLIHEAIGFKDELMVLLPILRKIDNESIYSRDVIVRDSKIIIKEYTESEIMALYDATIQYFELCFRIIESEIGETIPKNKDELTNYLITNYKEYIAQ